MQKIAEVLIGTARIHIKTYTYIKYKIIITNFINFSQHIN